MRPARVTMVRTKPATPDGPATETIVPVSVGLTQSTSVVGGTAAAVLADASDSTYIDSVDMYGTGLSANSIACGSLVSATGRGIASLTLHSRVSLGEAGQFVGQINGGTVFAGSQPVTPSSITPVTFLALKPGGGNWTEAEVNALNYSIVGLADDSSGVGRIYQFQVVVTYA